MTEKAWLACKENLKVDFPQPWSVEMAALTFLLFFLLPLFIASAKVNYVHLYSAKHGINPLELPYSALELRLIIPIKQLSSFFVLNVRFYVYDFVCPMLRLQ